MIKDNILLLDACGLAVLLHAMDVDKSSGGIILCL